ncbi:MAG: hypothetical protein QXL15_04730 [Candidatus Korarchaeota archaeon]
MNLEAYYRDRYVRERMSEYCGGYGGNPRTFTSAYLVGYGPVKFANGQNHKAVPNEMFDWILNSRLDIFRSVWDHQYLIMLLDIEYYNVDYPAEILLNPRLAFSKLLPVHHATEEILRGYGISHLTIMTGQGFHYVSRIPIACDLYTEMCKNGNIEKSLEGRYRMLNHFSLDMGRAYESAGRMMEFLIHKIIRYASPNSPIPIYISDVAPPRGPKGREGVSLDLTMFGDGIHARDMRLPFSTHQKHLAKKWYYGEHVTSKIPLRVSLPVIRENPLDLLEAREELTVAAEIAARVSTEIPVEIDGWSKMYEDYLNSELKAFHDEFDSEQHDSWTEWPRTYLAFNYSWLPPCVRHVFANANPELLKPTQIQLITRILLSLGWHPKHIAGLIRAYYETNRGWGNMWYSQDAATRANWWVRVYSGLIVCGLDELVDLNCVSHKERGYCVASCCSYNLMSFQSPALDYARSFSKKCILQNSIPPESSNR